MSFTAFAFIDRSNLVERTWQYRFVVKVKNGSHLLFDKLVEVPVDFEERFGEVNKENKILLERSVRVIEIDERGSIISERLCQYDPGRVLWLLEGETAPGQIRTFHIYFNTTDRPVPITSLAPLVTRRDTTDRWQFDTPGGYYVFEKNGGAFEVFSPVRCQDNESGKDWVRDDYSRWNGILNIGDPRTKAVFHPNEDEEADDSITKGPRSQIVYAGPLCYRLKAINRFGDLQADYRSKTVYRILYDIMPFGIRAILTKGNPHGVACIMEMTPGGDASEATDYVVRSDGTRKLKNERWEEDISPEWLYVGDQQDEHKLYFYHTRDDSIKDGLKWFESMQAAMVGWGRGAYPGISVFPDTFYFGFSTQSSLQEIGQLMNSLSGKVSITTGPTEIVAVTARPDDVAPAQNGGDNTWFTADTVSKTIGNRWLEVSFGPDLFTQGHRVRGITRMIYKPTNEDFARALDVYGCGYSHYHNLDGTTVFYVSKVNDEIVEATIHMQGCVDVDKKYRLYKDLPVLEIQYDKLDIKWWEDFYTYPADTNRVYTILGIAHDITPTQQAYYRKKAEEKCGHNFGDCFLSVAGVSIEQATYQGYLIFGFHDRPEGRGLGFVIPSHIGLHSGFKLWSMQNYESFPFRKGYEKKLPLKRWIFVTTTGREGILKTGQRIVDRLLAGRDISGITW